jgi:hypothetical protein
MRFQDAARDARAVVYAGIQADPLVARLATALAEATTAERLMARAVMNGERVEADAWRRIFPTLFEAGARGASADASAGASAGAGAAGAASSGGTASDSRAETILALSLQVADKGESVRSQFRGAIVEELTARLLVGGASVAGTAPGSVAASVKRERRVLFDGVPAEIHPYDVTVESPTQPRVYDCKWGARGINADVLNQLDDARAHAADEDVVLAVALVIFDSRRSCEIRLRRSTANRSGTGLIGLEDLDRLAEAR